MRSLDMLKKIIFLKISILFLLFFTTFSFADTIYLKNGNKVSGIIVRENEDSVEVKINVGAIVTFSKQDIERIEKSAERSRAKMEDVWKAKKAKRKVTQVEKDDYIKEQIEKGLIEHDGEWITSDEREKLQAVNIARDSGRHRREKRFSSKSDRKKRSSFSKKLLDKGNWLVRETMHFSIFYRDLSQAKIVSDKAEYYFEKITYDLDYEDEIKWDKKCQVYIVENVVKWRDFLKDIGFSAELVGGFVPNYGEKEMFLCALSDGYLALTFPHELTHLIFSDIAGKSTIPLWLNEGLANYEANVTSVSNKLLIKYIKQGRHILLGDLLRMTAYPGGKNMRELFYAQSEKLVEFFITQYGRKRFREFCELILKDKSFRESLSSVYKGDIEDLEDFNIKLVEYIVR